MDKSISLLQFETSTACNAKCTFCKHEQMARKGVLPLTRIIDLLYHLAHKAGEICPFWMQEPTVEPRLPQILANCKAFAPRTPTTIYSNMGVFPAENWEKIIKWGVLDHIVISFYGTDRNTYQKLQPPLDYDKTRGNIKRLMKLRSRLGWLKPKVTMYLLITPETVYKANRFKKQWGPIVDEVGFTFLESWDTENPKIQRFNRQVWGPPPERVPCIRLYKAMYVAFNGDVAMCCQDYNCRHAVGNVFQDGYDIWWRSRKLQELRGLHEEGRWNEIPLCRNCTVWWHQHPKSWIQHWLKKLPVSIAATQ